MEQDVKQDMNQDVNQDLDRDMERDKVDYNKYHVTEYMLPDMESTFRVYAAHIRTVTKEWAYEEHSHPLFELNVVLSGSQKMIVNGQVYVQHAGDVMLLLPEDVHQSEAVGEEDLCYYCLHFNVDDRIVRERLFRLVHRFYSAEHGLTKVILPSLEQLVMITTQVDSAKIDNKMRTLSIIFALFASISEYVSEQMLVDRMGKSSDEVAVMIAERLERLVSGANEDSLNSADGLNNADDLNNVDDEVANNILTYNEQGAVAAVIADTGYSASSCNRRFHEVYGMSPRQYLSSLKLKRAKLLLMNPQLSIEHISIILGYKDIAHFSRQFKRWTGEPPGKFRARFHN
jgi:AraC-like DNA-binding protein